jgi:hypothetical protein
MYRLRIQYTHTHTHYFQLQYTMSVSAEVIAYCKHLDNSIIGCWEPPPPGYEGERDETNDRDWAGAIAVRLREMRLEEVVAEVKRRVRDEALRMRLVGEVWRVGGGVAT